VNLSNFFYADILEWVQEMAKERVKENEQEMM
jgi:hypothetical protein